MSPRRRPPPLDPLHRPWSLRELAEGPEKPGAVDRAQERMARTDADIRAWAERFPSPDPALDGPLAGVPLGVKDIIDVAGAPTRCGSPLRAEAEPAEADAEVVARWRALGAVPVGKTVTTEFAYFAPGPTRNPAARTCTPGGSSSGSAAAVAAGHVPLALGTQTAGSTIRPASFCGIAGLVLSHGRIPTSGIAALSGSLDRHGLFAASVDDLALAFSLVSGEDDAGGRPTTPPSLWSWTGESLGLVDPHMADGFGDAVEHLRRVGATVDPFPAEALLASMTADHGVVLAYEAARERAVEHRTPDQLSAPLRDLLDTGAALPHEQYQAAIDRIATARTEVTALLAARDAVLAPAAPGPAPEGLAGTGSPALSRAGQALGLPALAVPGLRTHDTGLPLGLQLLGRPEAETSLLGVGCWTERQLGRASTSQ